MAEDCAPYFNKSKLYITPPTPEETALQELALKGELSMKIPSPGDAVNEMVTIQHTIQEVIEVNHFTNTAKVRLTDGKLYLIGHKRAGDVRFQVITALAE